MSNAMMEPITLARTAFLLIQLAVCSQSKIVEIGKSYTHGTDSKVKYKNLDKGVGKTMAR